MGGPTPLELTVHASKVNDMLYIGGRDTTLDFIKSKKITHIVCLARELFNRYPSHALYTNVDIRDDPSQSLEPVFTKALPAIQLNISKGPTLIQCIGGSSRSAAAAIAFLVKYCRLTLYDAFVQVKNARPIIQPNIGFFRQLQGFEVKEHRLPSPTLSERDYIVALLSPEFPSLPEDDIEAAGGRADWDVVATRELLISRSKEKKG